MGSKRRKRSKNKTRPKPAPINWPEFDKYFYYSKSVQSPDTDVEFIQQVYQEWFKRKASIMREDFCAAFLLCCEWVKQGTDFKAIGIDIDQEPLGYGKSHYLPTLSESERQRVELSEINVLNGPLPAADVVCALNFSYFIFKERSVLKKYFEMVHGSLGSEGMFILDCFGGSKCYEANEEETEHEDLNFSYYWDQDSYNPIDNNGQFYIHFKRRGEPKREQVFSYDWRLWSLPELKDILHDAGFRQVHIYWEGTDEDGEGDGNFSKTEQGEECESWIAYIIALK